MILAALNEAQMAGARLGAVCQVIGVSARTILPVMDVWSRRIVGWEVHDDELAERAATPIQRICAESGIDPNGWCCTQITGSRCGGTR